MKFAGGRRVASPVDVTPLIDIIFQLVIFFMVTTNFITTISQYIIVTFTTINFTITTTCAYRIITISSINSNLIIMQYVNSITTITTCNREYTARIRS